MAKACRGIVRAEPDAALRTKYIERMAQSISGSTITGLTSLGVEATERRAERLSPMLSAALWAIAAAVIAGWLSLAVIHVNDDYRVTHNQGVWIAVSDAARSGRLYPPIFDGEHYAGTRYMPITLLLNGLASAIAGDPWLGGKLLAAGLMAVLLALVFFVLRGLRCPAPLAAALAAIVVATEAGLQAGSAIGGDLIPALLQLGALAAAMRSGTRRGILVAGGFAGLAIASKLTGFWAFLAITTWLAMQQQWRTAAIFAGVSAVTAAVVLGTVQVMTRGGLSQHLVAFSTAGVHSPVAWLRGPNQIFYNLLGHASAAVVLVPLALIGPLLLERWRDLSIVHLALGYAVVLLLIVYADVGTGFNQLLDVVVLTVLATGALAARAAAGDPRTAGVGVLTLAVTVVWAASLDLVRTVGFDLRRSVPAINATPRRDATAVARLVQPGDTVLTEDPSVDVALRRQPVVMDPFMVMRLDRAHPQQVDPLISWITERRFDLVILVVSLEDRSLDFWWNDLHFGPRVAEALRRSYVYERSLGRYYLYRPGRNASAQPLLRKESNADPPPGRQQSALEITTPRGPR
jgi:hypothetical protein